MVNREYTCFYYETQSPGNDGGDLACPLSAPARMMIMTYYLFWSYRIGG